MTYSLRVSNGDLVLQGNQLDIVSGMDKLSQDMQLWVAERYGIDRFHPAMGSLLQNFIGSAITAGTQVGVQQEVLRVLDNYAKVQLKAFKENPQNFSYSELLISVDAVNVSISYDTVGVSVQITNGTQTSTSVAVTAST